MNGRIETRPAPGATRKARRAGRGAGSNRGSTCGRGDKGQKSRSGGKLKASFEGGQMPLQRRLPKRGFRSKSPNAAAQVRLSELNRFAGEVVDLEKLKKVNVVPRTAERAKVIVSGEITESVTLRGIAATAGARSAIEAAKGSIED